ncbi:hypothetical protein ES708_30459 [subsurface metagenome]
MFGAVSPINSSSLPGGASCKKVLKATMPDFEQGIISSIQSVPAAPKKAISTTTSFSATSILLSTISGEYGGGTEMGISIIVVTPPKAASFEPLSKVSLSS